MFLGGGVNTAVWQRQLVGAVEGRSEQPVLFLFYNHYFIYTRYINQRIILTAGNGNLG
jgi:hypothetical protein